MIKTLKLNAVKFSKWGSLTLLASLGVSILTPAFANVSNTTNLPINLNNNSSAIKGNSLQDQFQSLVGEVKPYKLTSDLNFYVPAGYQYDYFQSKPDKGYLVFNGRRSAFTLTVYQTDTKTSNKINKYFNLIADKPKLLQQAGENIQKVVKKSLQVNEVKINRTKVIRNNDLGIVAFGYCGAVINNGLEGTVCGFQMYYQDDFIYGQFLSPIANYNMAADIDFLIANIQKTIPSN